MSVEHAHYILPGMKQMLVKKGDAWGRRRNSIPWREFSHFTMFHCCLQFMENEKYFQLCCLVSCFPRKFFLCFSDWGSCFCMILWFQMHISICVLKAISCLELHLISLSLVLTFLWRERWRLEHKIKGLLSQPRTFGVQRDLVKQIFFVEMLFGYSSQYLWHWNLFAAGIKSPWERGQIGVTVFLHRLASPWKLTSSSDPICYFLSWVGNFIAVGTRRLKASRFHVSLTGVWSWEYQQHCTAENDWCRS